MKEFTAILWEQRGRVGIITLNRPEKLNALGEDMIEGLWYLTEQANANPNIGCLILTGAGRGFCSGADQQNMAQRSTEGFATKTVGAGIGPQLYHLAELFGSSKPIIAAINGAAIGGGFTTALACDFRIGSDRARVSARFVRVGLQPEVGSTYLLPQAVGLSHAMEMFLSGRILDAEDAYRRGIFNELVPHDQLMDRAMEIAEEIAFNPMQQVQWAKRLVQLNATNSNMRGVLWSEEVIGEACLTTGMPQEASKAFLERRDPVFNSPVEAAT
jgi:2-(1,2-epoxy-1,2-dihydrophenyl)acetyl-CoA isomerase